jgi:hypothetical protein
VPPLARQARRLVGKLVGDTGSIAPTLVEQLICEHGGPLVTRLRQQLRHRLLEVADTLLLRTRAISESLNEQLTTIGQVEHARHRSPANCRINLLGGLIAYCQLPKKPSLDLGPLALPAA